MEEKRDIQEEIFMDYLFELIKKYNEITEQ